MTRRFTSNEFIAIADLLALAAEVDDSILPIEMEESVKIVNNMMLDVEIVNDEDFTEPFPLFAEESERIQARKEKEERFADYSDQEAV